MTSRVGTKGQVVIPKSIRDRAGLQPGDEVDFELRDDEVVVGRHARRPRLPAASRGAAWRPGC